MKLGKASGHSKALCRSSLCALTLIATILAVLSSASAFAASAREKLIYSFQGGSDGQNPYTALIADRNGNLYGTTVSGGVSLGCAIGCGTVFELSPPATEGGAWSETQLYVFQGGDDDGANPFGGLEPSPPATPGGQWTATVLHEFGGTPSDGFYPQSGLVFDRKGTLYGRHFLVEGTANWARCTNWCAPAPCGASRSFTGSL